METEWAQEGGQDRDEDTHPRLSKGCFHTGKELLLQHSGEDRDWDRDRDGDSDGHPWLAEGCFRAGDRTCHEGWPPTPHPSASLWPSWLR